MLDEYDKQGFVVIRGAIDASSCDSMCTALWDGLKKKHGIRREAQHTWTMEDPRGLGFLRASDAFAGAVSEPVVAAVNSLISPNSWHQPQHWFGPLVTFPSNAPWELPKKGWHIDYPARGNLGLRFGVKVLVLLTDMEPKGGATLLSPRSHLWVRELTHEQLDGNAGSSSEVRSKILQKRMDFSRGFFEFTGNAGDVLLFDPWLFHSASRNVNNTPRMMLEQNIPSKAALALYSP